MPRYEKIEWNNEIYSRDTQNTSHRKNYFYAQNGKKTLHREIWKEKNGDIPKGKHIHHKDGNPLNNSIDNLECLTHKEHMLAHSILAKNDPSKDIFKTRKEWQKSPDGLAHHRKIGKENWLKRKKFLRICNRCKKEEWFFTLTGSNPRCKTCRSINPIKKIAAIKSPKFIPFLVRCTVCNLQIFQSTKKIRLFCSKNCKTAHRFHSKIDHVARKCQICNKGFSINRYSKTKTCSDSCRSAFISLSMKSRSAPSQATTTETSVA